MHEKGNSIGNHDSIKAIIEALINGTHTISSLDKQK